LQKLQLQQEPYKVEELAYVKTAGSGSPAVVFKNGSSGSTLLSMVFHQSDDNQITIPDHGIIFPDECHVTLTNIDSITGFFG